MAVHKNDAIAHSLREMVKDPYQLAANQRSKRLYARTIGRPYAGGWLGRQEGRRRCALMVSHLTRPFMSRVVTRGGNWGSKPQTAWQPA